MAPDDYLPRHTGAQESTRADAKDRAWRTLLQNLAIDLSAAVVVTALPLVTDVQFSSEWWLALLIAIGKTAVATFVSYWYRILVRPGTPTP